AIELTAARTRAFSAQQLAELLDQRFGLVSTAKGGRPLRQQTMHAAVDWSYELLFDDERCLLNRLSVFSGGFTLDAAARVCADDTLAADDIDVLIARLVDKSLVAAVRQPGTTARFRLLRPVADYAAARLEDAGETAMIRTRHTRWLIDLTAGVTTGLRGRQSVAWAHLANVELANLVRAGEWGLSEGDPVDALQIGVNLGWYAFLSANVQNDEPVMLQLLELAGDAPPAALRCRALMWTGLLSIGRTAKRTWAMDAVDVARTAAGTGVPASPEAAIDGGRFTTDAIALARTTGDSFLLLETLVIGSLHLGAIGWFPEVLRSLNDEARALAETLGDPWFAAMVSGLDGLATYVAGDLEASMTTLRGAIDAFRSLHDNNTAALFEVTFSEVAELRGEIAEATSAMASAVAIETESGFFASTVLRAVLCWLAGRNGERERSLQLGREVVELAHQPFNPVIRAQALFALGAAETWADMTTEAAEHLGEALVIHERVGMQRETAMDHRHLGIVCRRLGDADQAMQHLRTALELSVGVGLPWTVMLVARSMARVLVGSDSEMAARLLGNTEAVSELFGYLPTPDERELVDGILSAATNDIGENAVAAAMAQGALLSYTELPNLFRDGQ
ncbi:MAG TPA: tetratricopeptide repeat protein, partial [Ilumatobacteraceae bacterium]|nr:tetratricopeptide repeat protein [Ilumatobacteraceae bacterium]